ncbi:hypothetical protein [Taklimakanibacter lacteus]|uniref:hypothetical protein n=1 Tax=Taklimakanibacter lacteus TaxID=2268456 RepID=UPI000E6682B6
MPVTVPPFILPSGVTGFSGQKPHDLFKGLKALSHEVARSVHGAITGSAADDLVGRNFHSFRLEGRGLRVVILLNAFHPLVGFAETEAHEPIFADIPDSFHGQNRGAFTFLGKEILTSPPDHASVRELASTEMEQMGYWRPRRLGDIIFNHWD